jgi:phosphoribosylaminoimidazole carboxylase PurE protein
VLTKGVKNMSEIEKNPLVGVIMGSDSDLDTMQYAGLRLDFFGVENEFRIISAHRTPEALTKYGHEAVERGLKIIIAGAGGSAHLQGMMASHTRLPVLGVAIESTDTMNAAFGSMVRMPKGIPLATMGKGEAGAENAALEAVRILALSDPSLAEDYDDYVISLRKEVQRKDAKLFEMGPQAYLASLKNITPSTKA